MLRIVAFAALWATTSLAEGERAGDFDYYVLALSWEPTFCETEGYAKGYDSCDVLDGWVLHGLWPQYNRGWPSYCSTAKRAPSRRKTASEAEIYGSSGSAWHQWRKHGVCSGLSADGYYATARDALNSVVRPALFAKLTQPVKLPAKVIEEAFLKENPGLEPDGLTVTCRDQRIQEVRICLSKSLDPVPCGRDVVRDCALDNALLSPAQ